MESIARAVEKRNVIWKYPSSYEDTYGACAVIGLDAGVVISSWPQAISQVGAGSQYSAACTDRELLMSAANDVLHEAGVLKLPLLQLGWQDYVQTEYQFVYTIYPIVYSLSCCTFIAGFLTIILFTKQYLRSQKPTGLMKLSTLTSCLHLTAVYVYAIKKLQDQHTRDISSGTLLIDTIQKCVPFNALDLAVVILLQLSQVQIIMRLFPRQKEKRFAFIVGLFLSLSSQTIWSVSTFVPTSARLGTDPDYDSTIAILPAFVYLLRIAMSVLFSCLFVVYFFNKRQFIFGPRILPLTVFTFIIMNSTFAVFIADVSNIWVSEMSELFNITSYVVTNVVTWEFVNRVVLAEKIEQRRGILGRQFYDEEDQELFDSYGNHMGRNRVIKKGKYDLIISSHDKDRGVPGQALTDVSSGAASTESADDGGAAHGKSWLSRSVKKFNDSLDKVIDFSFATPIGGASAESNASLYDTQLPKPNWIADFVGNRFGRRKEQVVDTPPHAAPSHPQPQVFVYEQREIRAPRHVYTTDTGRQVDAEMNHRHTRTYLQTDANSTAAASSTSQISTIDEGPSNIT